jgi:hypothetical protein
LLLMDGLNTKTANSHVIVRTGHVGSAL